MSKTIKVSRAIQIVAAYVLLLLFLLAWPLGIIKQQVQSGASDFIKWTSPAIFDTAQIIQEFNPQYNYLESISFYIANELEEERNFILEFYLFDSNQTVIHREELTLEGGDFPGVYTVPIKQYVDQERNYHYLIQAPYEELFLGCVKKSDSGAIEAVHYYHNNELQDWSSAYTIYEYRTPVMLWWKFAYIMCSIFFVFVIGWSANKIERKNTFLQNEYSLDSVINTMLILTVVGTTIGIMIAIFPLKLFGSNVLDIVVYEFAAAVSGGFLIYYFANIFKPSLVIEEVWKKKNIPNGLQIICFAMMLMHSCNYVNATYQYTHEINTRKIIVFLLLIILLMIDKKEIFKLKSAVIFIASCIGGIIYYISKLGMEHTELSEGLQSLALWEAYRIPLVVIVIYHFIRMIYQKRFQKLSYFYLAIFLLFWILQNYFANGRTWTQILVFPIGMYYLFYNSKENKTNTSYNFMYGIVYNFIGMVIYSLVHRPYHYYMHTRYSMYFHTVTITSMYLVLVFCVSLVLLINAYAKRNPIQIPICKVLLGASVAYVFMTISRLGILTLVGIVMGVMIVISIFARQVKWRVVIGRFCAVVITVLMAIPVFFMYTRIIPAITNDPVILDIEVTVDSIRWGESTDSFRYVTVERYLTLLFERYGVEANNEKEQSGITVLGEIASVDDKIVRLAQTNTIEQVENTPSIDTNGRVDIWKAYIEEINLTGHDSMGVMVGDLLQVHAHNSFLQVIHDHGLITGILFIVLYIASLIRGVLHYRADTSNYSNILPITIIGAFGIVSIGEWVFHPCNPLGLGFLLILAPLFMDTQQVGNRKNEKRFN